MTDWTQGLFASTLVVLVGLGLVPVSASAQDANAPDSSATGSVTGVIVEAKSGAPLPGANVKIKGTTTGTSTDLNGRYRLEGLTPGAYSLLFSFVGFQKKTVTGVEITAGQTTQLDVTLREEAAKLKGVVVEAKAARDSNAGLLKEREAAPVVSNAISADMMSKAGISNAADAMKKVTGASVVEGKYVYIRGLGDRYTTTQLNGIAMPTASPNRDAVQFDLFSTNLLDNIVTKKTFTPDLPGNFAGGLTNINTESYPANLTFQISSSTSIGTQTHFTNNFLSTPGGKWDFLAIGDGTRSLPDPVQSLTADQIPSNVRRTVSDQLGNGGGSEAGVRLNKLSRSFNNNMAVVRGRAPLNQSYSLSIGNEINSAGDPLGVLLNLNYGYSSSYYEGFQGRYRGPRGDGSDSLDTELLVNEAKGTTTAKLGGLLSLNYRLAQNHELGATAMYTRHGESTAQTRFGQWPEQFGSDPTVHFQDRNLHYTRRELYSTQLRGRHLFPGLGDTEIEWTTGVSDTRQEEPDTRLFGNLVREQMEDGAVVDTSYVVDLTGFPPPTRYYRELNENSYSAKVDVSIPFGGNESTVKVGGSYRVENRTFNERGFVFEPPSNPSYNGNPEAYFADDNMGITDTLTIAEGTPFERKSPEFGNTVYEESEAQDRYQGDQTVAAGYAMVDWSVTERLRLIGGARVERTDLQIESEALEQSTGSGLSPDDTTDGAINVMDVLPSLNAVYELRDDMNLRFAATRTLARPTFREIAPFSRESNVLGELVIGNPSLDRSLITNLDLRWEWFPAPGEIVGVSVFGKGFRDAIEVYLLPTTNGQRTWANTDARVYGAEFELRTQLGRFADLLTHFTLGTNLSLIHSAAEEPQLEGGLGDDSYNGDGGGPQNSRDTRPLQGQSPYTFNMDLSYENPNTGTSAGLYFNTFGERLTALGVFQKPDVYEQPFHQLNVTFSQRFRDHWTVDLSVENLLGDTARKIHPFRENEFVYQRTPEERAISLGLSYEL